MILSVSGQIGLTDVILLLGILGILLDRVADARGWSRSSKTLRRENQDLLRRNGELEATVARHESEIGRLGAQIDLLKERDQTAVLKQLELHETNADRRATRTVGLLEEIRDNLKGGIP